MIDFERKTQTVVTTEVVIRLPLEEAKLIYNGIGETSETSRVKAGMTSDQSQALGRLYADMHQSGFNDQ